MPCYTSINRFIVLLPWMPAYRNSKVVLGGDISFDTDVDNPLSDLINRFTDAC